MVVDAEHDSLRPRPACLDGVQHPVGEVQRRTAAVGADLEDHATAFLDGQAGNGAGDASERQSFLVGHESDRRPRRLEYLGRPGPLRRSAAHSCVT